MITESTEKRFESDIEAFFISPEGGYSKGADTYDTHLGVYKNTLIDFIKRTQPKEWARFEGQNAIDPEKKFCLALNNACDMDGLLSVLRHGFKHRGIKFRLCFFKPESSLNQTAAEQYAANTIECYRQWFYSPDCKKSVDMVLVLNGIPVFAFELKNQYTGQTIDNARKQWMYDRDPRELCFQFNKRILAYFCVDHTAVLMTTKLAGKDTFFLPFNQGSNGAGNDGGKGNPANPDGYPTAYLWEHAFQKDSMMDILQKFMHLQKKDGKQTLIFPRYHQLDVVRKLIADVSASGAGKNYLIQHSAGSGKSNSIAWTAYRLASLHRNDNKPGKQDKSAMGRMTSALKPSADRYNLKTPDERYQFRRNVRSLVRWYGYITQIVRMFDEDMQKEAAFCAYLLPLLPVEQEAMIDLEGKLQLEYYKLQKTYEGSIELENGRGEFEAASGKSAAGKDEKEPLDEIIEKINEKHKGEWSNGDKVVLNALTNKLMADKALKKKAKSSDPQIFINSIFPKAFDEAAQDSYMESQDTYTSLFEDKAKYNAVMMALAEFIYREMRA